MLLLYEEKAFIAYIIIDNCEINTEKKMVIII